MLTDMPMLTVVGSLRLPTHRTTCLFMRFAKLLATVEFLLCRLAPATANELGPVIIDLSSPLKQLLLLSFFFKLEKIAI